MDALIGDTTIVFSWSAEDLEEQHSTIDDAENTAYIFQEMQADNFREKYKELLDLFKPTEGLTFSIGSMFADLMEQVSCAG